MDAEGGMRKAENEGRKPYRSKERQEAGHGKLRVKNKREKYQVRRPIGPYRVLSDNMLSDNEGSRC